MIAIIRQLLPEGSELRGEVPELRAGRRQWKWVPRWPADLFAVAATLVKASSCYADYSLNARGDGPFTRGYAKRVRRLGRSWRKARDTAALTRVLRHLQQLWSVLLRNGREPVNYQAAPGQPPPAWCAAALELMALADEASAGTGFVSATSPFAEIALARHFEPYVEEHRPKVGSRKASQPLTDEQRSRRTESLCILVPPDVACVQPKSRTPQVGCSINSLSQHLALLPAIGEVQARWMIAPTVPPIAEPLNLLLVPLPYQLGGRCFREHWRAPAGEGWGCFRMEQSWLPEGSPDDAGTQIAAFLEDLLEQAGEEVGRVHGLVLPELALDLERGTRVAELLARSGANLEFFTTGVLTRDEAQGRLRNEALTYLYQGQGLPPLHWRQSKHHRWKLERSQIARYHLGHALAPELEWWEDIDVRERKVTFYTFREGASLAVLICEDLARIEPVQPVIRAVGPNLVIALLMDGPQLEARWPGRYATVLADDPGSAVLTLTSLGMTRRSAPPGEAEPRAIGLWKDSTTGARTLVLPGGKHGVVLTVSAAQVEQRTLDRRSDRHKAVQLALTGVRAVTAENPPGWAQA